MAAAVAGAPITSATAPAAVRQIRRAALKRWSCLSEPGSTSAEAAPETQRQATISAGVILFDGSMQSIWRMRSRAEGDICSHCRG
eukprot:scaffold19736_cov28-Tisochrysis_lutea.AAC.4